MRGIMTCVDFADVAAITLPWNRHHFEALWVVTTPGDEATIAVAKANDCRLVLTGLFYYRGAEFAKWTALEHGLDMMGRQGELAIMDVDILIPKAAHLHAVCGYLCTPKRRMLEDLSQPIPLEEEWGELPLHPQQTEWAGYLQMFSAADPVLGRPPWHETDWRHAGGADSAFQAKWPTTRKTRPPWEVLHLGPSGINWMGRASPYLDGRTPDDAEQRKQQLRSLIRQRTHGPDRFRHEKLPPPGALQRNSRLQRNSPGCNDILLRSILGGSCTAVQWWARKIRSACRDSFAVGPHRAYTRLSPA